MNLILKIAAAAVAAYATNAAIIQHVEEKAGAPKNVHKKMGLVATAIAAYTVAVK